MKPNAIVRYVDAETGETLGEDRFYDPGLDPQSSYTREMIKSRAWPGLHLAYRCGRPLMKVELLALDRDA